MTNFVLKIKETISELRETIDYYNDADVIYNITLPDSVFQYKHKNYIEIRDILKSVGFRHIFCNPLDDLLIGFINKPNAVSSVTINDQGLSHYKEYTSKDLVTINYHSFIRGA